MDKPDMLHPVELGYSYPAAVNKQSLDQRQMPQTPVHRKQRLRTKETNLRILCLAVGACRMALIR